MITMMWRTGRAARAGVVLMVLLCLGALAGLSRNTVAEGAPPTGSALVLAVIAAPVAALMVWTAWGPYVALTDQHVLIRNVVRRHRVPLRQIVAVSPGFNGIELELAHGTVVTAWAVQKANVSRWLGRHTRADDVAAAITDAARSAGAVIAADDGLFWLGSSSVDDH